MKSGEGKSLIIAVVSIIFALLGYEVNCACSNSILSKRDRKKFEKLFNILSVSGNIYYATINDACEKLINDKDYIRNMILKRILK